jgi:transcriptional regulator with XRE-family HTH domain
MAGRRAKPPDPDLVALGQRVARLRNARGRRSQTHLAMACGLGTSQIQAIESATKEPRYTTLLKVARGLEVDPALLVSDVYPPNAPVLRVRPETDWNRLREAAEEWLRICADMTAYQEASKRPRSASAPTPRRRRARR